MRATDDLEAILRRLKSLQLETYELEPRYLRRGEEWVVNPKHPPEKAWRDLIAWATSALVENDDHASK